MEHLRGREGRPSGGRGVGWGRWQACPPLPKPVFYSYQLGNLSFLTSESVERKMVMSKGMSLSVLPGGNKPTPTGSAGLHSDP